MIQTERLDLIPATVEALDAEPAIVGHHDQMRVVLDVEVPVEWPPDLLDRGAIEWTRERLREDEVADGGKVRSGRDGPNAGWWLHYIVLRRADEPDVLIGSCGYKGPPSEDGTVEIGYGILTEFRRRGYATEASRGLVDNAFEHDAVRRVIAETLPELTPSKGVLDKLGFRFIGDGSEEGVIRYELQRSAEQG